MRSNQGQIFKPLVCIVRASLTKPKPIRLFVAGLLLNTLVWSCLVPFPASAMSFLSALPDMPLPQSFQEDPEAQVIFDTVKGRVLSAAATGPGTEAAVVTFYTQSLPSLGWRTAPSQDATLTFVRDEEQLVLFVYPLSATQSVISFHLAPRP